MSANLSEHAESTGQQAVDAVDRRLIDNWFPCGAVDEAVNTTAGSGRNEKAIFTWFASRPIAQARAAVIGTLVADDKQLRPHVQAVVLGQANERRAREELERAIHQNYPGRTPVVLDMFSGRGIIPLEAARLGVTSVGVDLSPVATLGGLLLADYPFRDWSAEPSVPFAPGEISVFDDGKLPEILDSRLRLLSDTKAVLAEVERRVQESVAPYYPRNQDGRFPWAYLWAVTIPCDKCKRRFPLIGSLRLSFPSRRTRDYGQSLRLMTVGDTWRCEVVDGETEDQPTFTSAPGRKGKSGRCLFCGHIHTLDAIKAKGSASQYEDTMLAVGEENPDPEGPSKFFRLPHHAELQAAAKVDLSSLPSIGKLSAVPDELIPPGNEDTIRASGYGYRSYGDLMNPRQTLLFAETVRAIRAVHADLLSAGISSGYAAALAGYAAANMQRRIRTSTRGARLRAFGGNANRKGTWVQVHDVFADESKVSFQFDYLESGPGTGPGTWSSVSESGLNALRKVLLENPESSKPARFRCASATSLPYRDNSVDAVITDPPYYNMIDYADVSDLFHVWFKRALSDIMPDLFGTPGLQDKSDEIIIKRGNAPGEHRTAEFYQKMLASAFREAQRVLRPDGHLVVVFGHSDPDAWRRLLGALHDAEFVVTSAWPSRTETSNTGVASIKVTVTIGCRVAKPGRPTATAAQVDREVNETIKRRVREWDSEGLALADQLMASYGPAMEVYGRYSKVLRPDGSVPPMQHYLNLALGAVREATAVRVDDLPLETFDAATRFAVFWLRLYGLSMVPKGDARFLAQADGLRLDDLRGRLLTESKAGFKLRIDDPEEAGPASSTFELARALADAWTSGGTEAAAEVLARTEREPTDPHLWAIAKEITAQLPPSDTVAKALSAITRNASSIGSLVSRRETARKVSQGALFNL